MMDNKLVKLVFISAIILFGSLLIVTLAFFAFLLSIRKEPISSQKITPSKSLMEIHPIPGLSSSSTLTYLSKSGFQCGQPLPFNDIFNKIFCEKTMSESSMVAWVFTTKDNSVYLIDANISQLSNPSDDIAVKGLLTIAGLPYEGSQPDLAYQWIAITMPKLSGEPADIKETSLAGIRFRLYGTPSDRSLEIGEIQ
jgi:hypothetical protein